MICGKDLWNDTVTEGLAERLVNGSMRDYYAGTPITPFEALLRSAARFPDKTFMIDDDGRRYTFSDFQKDSLAAAETLRDKYRVARGSRVGILMYNTYSFFVSFLALNSIGATAVLLPTKYRTPEIMSLIKLSKPALVLCHEEFAPQLAKGTLADILILPVSDDAAILTASDHPASPSRPRAGEAGDPAAIFFTSGTTSRCKGVVIRNYNMMHAAAVYQRTLGTSGQDKTIICTPAYYVTGLIAMFLLFLDAGGTVYLHKKFQARRVLETVVHEGITFLHASPTVFLLLMGQKALFPALPSLRMLACGSSNMPVERLHALHSWLPGMEFRTVYGLTETASPAAIFPSDAAVSPYIGSSGLPIPGTVFKIISDDGSELGTGEVGEIAVSGTVVAENYYNATADTLKDGWLRTGDMGYFNESGYLYIVDRKKDMINRGGEKVCSYDVENELLRIPGIIDSAVVGIPDSVYGEVPAAAIVLASGVKLPAENIQAFLCQTLAKYQIPVRFLFLDFIPQTRNSKADKKAVQALFQAETKERSL